MAEPGQHTNYLPTASWSALQQRAKLLRQLRHFFDERGFVEVETPLLSADTVVDRHLDPLPVTLFSDACHHEQGPRYWLQTSPEFGMKRLLAAGATKIYQVARAFRAGECGRLHNPEFTIVEWYRVGDSCSQGQQLLADLAVELLPVTHVDRLSYREAFLQYVGLDPFEATIPQLVEAASEQHSPAVQSAVDRDACLNLLLGTRVEPELGRTNPVILYDYPASQAALATINQTDSRTANRFELYYRGIELANGYHELLDAQELRRRTSLANRQRADEGKFTLPEESHLLEAMQAGLPPSAGVALGFDRLAMLALGFSSIDATLAFPISRA